MQTTYGYTCHSTFAILYVQLAMSAHRNAKYVGDRSAFGSVQHVSAHISVVRHSVGMSDVPWSKLGETAHMGGCSPIHGYLHTMICFTILDDDATSNPRHLTKPCFFGGLGSIEVQHSHPPWFLGCPKMNGDGSSTKNIQHHTTWGSSPCRPRTLQLQLR